MATYYVRTDGSDSNAGTGPATNQAWQTITKAIGATGIAPGDTLYIAPGVYRGAFTAAFTSPSSEGQRITIAGNPTASQFSGVTPGPVIITNFTDATTASGVTFTCATRNFVTLQDLYFVGYRAGGGPTFGTIIASNGIYQIIRRCGFYSPSQSTDTFAYYFEVPNGSRGPTIEDCVFVGHVGVCQLANTGSSYNSQTLIRNNIFINVSTGSLTQQCLRIDANGTSQSFGGVSVINNRFIGPVGIRPYATFRVNTTFPVVVQNCIFDTTIGISSNATGDFVESYNIFNGTTERQNVATGTGSLGRAFVSPDFTLSRVSGWGNLPFWSNHFASASQNAGINTNSDTTDFYGVTWLAPSTPTIGPIEYFSNTAIGAYLPTERNASAITIAPASTSQSIELYLGATGLTFATSGLAAYYVRNQAAPVAITLVTQTPTGAWSSGGFAEIDSSLVPGVYRLDVPNAALIAGASDVTIVVRGASGTNGAVLTVMLINEPTDAVLVRMGPFQVLADGLGASDPLDIQTGAQHGIDIQCVDSNGSGIDITSATVTAKVYNSGGTLVDTYSCTATYAADGRATFTIDTTVTATSGTYTVTVTRTTGATDTQIFGPLRLYVRPV